MITRRAPVENLAGNGRTELDATTSRYLGRVLRLKEGDAFVAFDPKSALEADARIVGTNEGALVIELGDVRSAKVVAPRRIRLVQALAKGDKCDAILRDATELGATSIVFAETERSVVKLAAARAKARVARWERIAQEAARQSLRGDVPAITTTTWSDAMASSSEESRFVLDPRAAGPRTPFIIAMSDDIRDLAFAIGPEGGLTSEELQVAEKQGWMAISLGPIVLRTETMAAALLGAARVMSTSD